VAVEADSAAAGLRHDGGQCVVHVADRRQRNASPLGSRMEMELLVIAVDALRLTWASKTLVDGRPVRRPLRRHSVGDNAAHLDLMSQGEALGCVRATRLRTARWLSGGVSN
jgi:hypothetical protein